MNDSCKDNVFPLPKYIHRMLICHMLLVDELWCMKAVVSIPRNKHMACGSGKADGLAFT
jgi:hypothetical protein